jgi:hypothetical protein
LELNRTHQLLVYADVNLLSENKKDMGPLFDASQEVGLEVITEKIKYMFMSHHQIGGQNHYIMVGNKYFETSSNIWG